MYHYQAPVWVKPKLCVCDDVGDCSLGEVTSAEYVRLIGRLRISVDAYIATRRRKPAGLLRRFFFCRGVIRTKEWIENSHPIRSETERTTSTSYY